VVKIPLISFVKKGNPYGNAYFVLLKYLKSILIVNPLLEDTTLADGQYTLREVLENSIRIRL